MITLPLAVDIADTVANADRRDSAVDIEANVERLLHTHPEAEATREDIADTLCEQIEAAGLDTTWRQRSYPLALIVAFASEQELIGWISGIYTKC